MKPAYSPPRDNKVVTAAILAVYDEAGFNERQRLNKLVRPLIKRCPYMSRKMAIEIIGKCGVWLARNENKS